MRCSENQRYIMLIKNSTFRLLFLKKLLIYEVCDISINTLWDSCCLSAGTGAQFSNIFFWFNFMK